ncbi:23841_t:CDS:2 [Gigaspora rosea]|nr:23841_t:CDS:2 [Gigaspora rosea]
MEREDYTKLLQYLTELKLPEELMKGQVQKLKMQARHYLVREGVLYKQNWQDPDQPLRVVERGQELALRLVDYLFEAQIKAHENIRKSQQKQNGTMTSNTRYKVLK